MNTRQPISDSSSPVVLNVAFNDDHGAFTVALEDGYRMYKTDTCEALGTRGFEGGFGHVQLLGFTQYMALVGGGKNPQFPPNRVQLVNDESGTIFCTMEFRAAVLGVRMTKEYLVVVMLNAVNLYKFKARPERLASMETANNPSGLCCLGKRLYAFPARTPGQVRIVDLKTRNVSIIPAHTGAIQAIGLSKDEEILVSASETGTLIRVWSTSNCSKLAELRRGVEQSTIFSLGISPSNKYLAVTSDKSTLHIFDLEEVLNPGANREAARRRSGSGHRYSSSPSSVSYATSPDGVDAALLADVPQQKYGVLAQIPLMPRLFSDNYSFATAHFESADEEEEYVGAVKRKREWSGPGLKPVKGLVGWASDDELYVIGAGFDARWEKFVITGSVETKRACIRLGWKRYMD